MATKQTEELIELYTQKIELETQQLQQINYTQSGYTIKTGVGSTEQIKIWGSNQVLENYNVPIKKLDNKIIELNNQIANLQESLKDTGQEANGNGCIGITTQIVYKDILNYKGYSFSGSNPFQEISGSLNINNSGIGTEDYVSQVSIGSYFGPIGSWGICANYQSTITSINSQISSLQSERNDLIVKVNYLKNAKSQYELQNYAYERSKTQLNSSINTNTSIINFLKDPNNSEWL